MSLFISKVQLRRSDPTRRALAAQLARAAEADGSHALVSMLFPEAATRCFLWREDRDANRFAAIVVSREAPVDQLGLFNLTTKAYAPTVKPGDEFAFALRANPVVRRRDAFGRVEKHDVAMDALRASGVPKEERADRRWDIARDAVSRWLVRQGRQHGFAVDGDTIEIVRSERWRVPHGRPGDSIRFTTFDLSGRLRVTDVDAFHGVLTTGLGAARAYGCGLLLIRRV